MKIQRTWATVHFQYKNADIELTLNYQTKEYTLTHGSNDNNVTFNGKISDIHRHLNRLKCVSAVLKYVQTELNIK